jgi:L-ribulokinase
MTSLKPKQYKPIAANRKIYDQLYALYRKLHDAFGGREKSADLSNVMKDLLTLKESTHA